MEQNVSGGEGLAIGIFAVRGREGSLVMGVGDDTEAGGYDIGTGLDVHVARIGNLGPL